MIKTLLQSLCFSNLWISFAAWLNFLAYSKFFDHSASIVNGCLVFFSTLFLYNFQRIWLLPYPPTGDQRHDWINKNKQWLKFLALLSALVCCVCVFFLEVEQIILGAGLLLVSVAYSFIPGKKPLRSLGVIKTLLVALVWGLVIFFFAPFDWVIDASLSFEFLRFVLLVYLLTLLFEYRDRITDNEATLARILTIKRFVGVLVTLCAVLVAIDVINRQFYLLIADGVLLPIVLWWNFKTTKAIFYSFVVDGFLVINAIGLFLEIG